MKLISYYELLEMIKNGIIPKVVDYKVTGYIENYIEYTAQYDRDTFTHYEITNHNRVDENIHFFLNENYLESDMFYKDILIKEDTPKEDKKIEKLGAFNIKKFYDDYPETAHFILEMFNKQEELIDKVNSDK